MDAENGEERKHHEASTSENSAETSTNGEKREKGKQKEKPETVPFHKLFAFADSTDILLMAVGTIGAIGNGLGLPLMTLLFGQMIDSFGSNQQNTHVVEEVSKVSLKFVYLAVGSGMAAFLQVTSWMVTGERQAARIRGLYLKTILRQDVAFFDKETNTGEVIGRMSGDTVLIQDAMGEKVGGALINHGDVVCTHRFSSHSLVLGENQVSVITNKQNRKEYGFDSERSTMKNDHNNNNNNSAEHSKDTTVGILDSRFNQTLRNVQGLLKGRNIPGKILLSQRVESPDYTSLSSPTYIRSSSYSETGTSDQTSETVEEEVHSTSKPFGIPNDNKLKISASNVESSSEEVRKSSMGARATDSARVMKFTKVLSETMVKLEKLREFSWSGVPDYMRPTVWRLLLGYAPPNSDRREGVLKRKRLEYLDCVSQYYDIPDTERSDDEINMLRQIAVDCPRTVPEVSFFQQQQVQKSLERILYTWAIRHPASGYVQGINDLVTPFLVVFLSEYLEGGIDNWSMSDLSSDEISNIEADCYWCLSKLLDGMQDHYTFAQPGIQRLVFKLKELVRRIDDPASNHMEEQGLEFLQFAFRWFNCLLIREIPFHLVTRLWDTYLAEGDALPDFLVYISASFLLTWSDKLQKLDFQEMVMFLQHLPTKNWTQQELEMVLSRAFMWHSMFNNSPSHLAN